MEELIVGTIVHFVLDQERNKGEHRPAIIVRTWGNAAPYPVQLQVFTDGSNDGPIYGDGLRWETSVPYSEDHEPRTWHFIEPV